MQQERGFKTCLFCTEQKDLLFGNDLVQKIVQNRFETDTFDIMLQNTNICLKCIGRFQQLNEFLATIGLESTKYANEKSNKKCCDMCHLQFFEFEVISPKYTNSITKEFELTNWNRCNQNDHEIVCCYSCYNFITTLNETKLMLDQLLNYFYSAVNSCKIILTDCMKKENRVNPFQMTNVKQEFFDSLSLTPLQRDNDFESCRQSIARFASEINFINPRELSSSDSNNSLVDKFNCSVVLERLNVNLVDSDSIIKNAKKSSRYRPEKKAVKIKLNTKKKIVERKINNIKKIHLRSHKKAISEDKEELFIPDSKPLEPSGSANALDPLTASENSETVKITENIQLNLPKEENNNKLNPIEIVENSNKKTSVNESKVVFNKNKEKKRSRASLPKKRKKSKSRMKPKKFQKLQKTGEQILSETTESCDKQHENITSPYEIKESIVNTEESYLNESTEIEFLHPKFKNKAVIFANTSRHEEPELLSSFLKQNIIEMTAVNDDCINMEMDNVEYLENVESIEDLLNNRNSHQNDINCPIFTMDELLNEDSLINVS